MLHKTVNMVVFFFKNDENTYPKGGAILQMYRVVPQTKRGNSLTSSMGLLHILFRQKSRTVRG